jgi:bifunctional oligoribonuclease and PAP phosphatase NrnA
MQLSGLRTKILENDLPVIISTHQNPDGDGLGSEIALAHCIKKLGKDVIIINQDKTPSSFKFLEQYFPIRIASGVTPPEKALVLLVDMHEMQSAGPDVSSLIDKVQTKEVIFINHHSPKYFETGYTYILFDSASSTGEIAYKLIKEELKVPLDKIIAECIYTAIISDTRSFRYSKTTSYSHQIASDLLEYGIQAEKIQLEVFGSNTMHQIHLLGLALQNTRLSNNGKVAYTYIPLDAMLQNNITPNDTKGFINHLLTIKGVEIAVLIRQDNKEMVKVSIRSKGNYPIYDLAEEHGGGGHKFAASFRSNMAPDAIIHGIVEKLEKLTVETLN